MEEHPAPAQETELGALVGAAKVKAGAWAPCCQFQSQRAGLSCPHGAGNETLGHIREGVRMRHPSPPPLAVGILQGLHPQGKQRSGKNLSAGSAREQEIMSVSAWAQREKSSPGK